MNIVKYVETGYIGFVPTSKTSNFCKRRMGLIPPVEYVELKDAIEKAGL